MLILCDNAEAYLDGYKLALRIGNPANMNYLGIELVFRTKAQQAAGADGLQVGVPSVLRAGAWNTVHVVVHPLRASEIPDLTVQAFADKVELR